MWTLCRELYKKTEPIDMQFGISESGGRFREHVLQLDLDVPRERALLAEYLVLVHVMHSYLRLGYLYLYF